MAGIIIFFAAAAAAAVFVFPDSSPYTSIIEFLVQAGQDTLITQVRMYLTKIQTYL